MENQNRYGPARLFTLIALLAATFAVGYTARSLHEGKKSEHVQIRLDDYRYTRPLLECDGNHSGSHHPDLEPFRKAVQRTVDEHLTSGDAHTIALYFRDLQSGAWFGVNDQQQFTPASLMKVPLMIAVMKHAERDADLLQKKIRYQGGDIHRYQGILPEKVLQRGSWYTVDDLLFRMIAYSDNDAALLLSDRYGMDILSKTLEDLRVPVSRETTGTFITVRDFTAFYRVLFNASYLGHALSERALSYLARSTFADGIRTGIPEGTPVASKFGEYSAGAYQLHEFGIIYHPEHPYLLGVVTMGGTRESLTHVIQELSSIVYLEIIRQHE
jgi:beta-lactamase class A